jgi:Dolichyl-phosphate-mannose-protein mannosyltransferase
LKDVITSSPDSTSRLPAWARAADLLALALLLLSVVVAVFGGFRFRVSTVRFSITSAWRVLIWGVGVVAIRHALIRRAPLYQRLIDWARASSQSLAFRAAWPAVLGTRLPVLLVGYFAVVTVGYAVAHPPNRISDNEFFNLPSRWDTGWYAVIATNGYRWDPRLGPSKQQNVVFFPAYPMLMRIGGRLIGERPVLAGMLVSFIAFFVALIYLYRLARQWLDHEQAVTALWLLASYPFALFFSVPYTESLYLCGVVAAFYHFHQRQFAQAGVWGALVGLTRPNGCLLSIPLAILAAEHLLGHESQGSTQQWRRLIHGDMLTRPDGQPTETRRTFVTALAAAAMPGIGMLGYSAFVYSLTGGAFSWAQAHVAWGREYTGLASLVIDRYKYIANQGFYDYTASVPLDVINAVPALFALSISWLVFKRFGLAYTAFLLLNLIPPMVVGGLLSVGRFTSVLFPAFFGLALLVSARARPGWIAAFAMGQALNATLFFTWRQLY